MKRIFGKELCRNRDSLSYPNLVLPNFYRFNMLRTICIKGGNSRLDSIQAAVLGAKLKHMDKFNEERREHAKKYTELLSNLQISQIVRLPKVAENVVPVWHLFVVQVEQRDELLKHLNEKKIGASIHYPVPIHMLGAYEELRKEGDKFLPCCMSAAPKLISLPMYPELSSEAVETVARHILDWSGLNQ